jgi:hypothetical protein
MANILHHGKKAIASLPAMFLTHRIVLLQDWMVVANSSFSINDVGDMHQLVGIGH